ncbi:MAG: tryptophanase [Chitinivibrionales bacterium]|nr:tryptophanase [Chitinivibrionales bacterium]
MAKYEPYKIKSIRNCNFYSLSQRKSFLRQAHYNVCTLPASAVTFDLVNQGSSAMSQEQVGSLFIGDEAYAGARNFYAMSSAVKEVFDLDYLCPIHNRFGGMKMLCAIHVKKGDFVAANTTFAQQTVSYFGATFSLLPTETKAGRNGDIDIEKATQLMEKNKGKIPFIVIEPQGNGCTPVSFKAMTNLKRAASAQKSLFVIDASCITQYANFLLKNDSTFKNKKVTEIIKQVIALSDTVIFDAGQDAMSNVGGFLGTNNHDEYEKQINEVVVFEGLHTYGGMAGRTMEVIARGIKEMVNEQIIDWHEYQVDYFYSLLRDFNVPCTKGLQGVSLKSKEFLPKAQENQAMTIAAALYLSAGIRVNFDGCCEPEMDVPLLLPRRALLNDQLNQIAQAVKKLYDQREKISALTLTNQPVFCFEARLDWLCPDVEAFEFSCTPYTVHSIEYVSVKNNHDREKAIKEAGYNTFLLKSEDVTIDFLTDSGTCAMSVDQWAKYIEARETPATPDAYLEVVKASQETYGYQYVILTHQGRAAEHIMSQMFIKPGDYVPGNMYFTTTREHQEMAGGIFVDVIVDEAHQTTSDFAWKGNISLKKLDDCYQKAQREGRRLSYISFEFNVNLAGGQPVSMDNIKEVYAYCTQRNIPVFFDATRCAENACFIQKHDPRYHSTAIKDILLEMFSYGHGATISSKKDPLSNLSGTLLFRDNKEWFEQGLRLLQMFEGPYSSGGTSAGDMAAHAQGLREMVGDRYINNRVDQVAYLGKLLIDAGIPIVVPCGGHGIFLDARRFLSHLDQDEFPAQMLAAQLFIETGVRAMERGNVSKGRDHKTGKNYRPALELVRLTIPRRVYTFDQMKMVAEGIIQLYKKRETIKGLRFTYESPKLRFFQSKFEEITQ